MLEEEGVRKIYISPIVNDTYKSGVENLVYNSLLKNLASNQWIILVQSPDEADAILQGAVTQARYWAGSTVAGSDLPRTPGTGGDFSKVRIANEYISQLDCRFSLVRRNPPPGRPAIVWSSTFSRSRPFPASNKLGPLGTTSSLINESEFDRTLSDMTREMMADVRESIFNRF